MDEPWDRARTWGRRSTAARTSCAFFAALLAALASCRDEEPLPRADEAPETELSLEALRALGYVDASEEEADPDQAGARVLDATAVCPGYRLYTAINDCSAHLIAVDGTVVHTWRAEDCERWMHADLLPDGDLLVPGVDDRGPDGSRRHLLRIAWDGAVVWKSPLPAHHDAERAPSGAIVTLTDRPRQVAFRGRATDLMDNGVAMLSDDGELVAEVSLYDVLQRNAIGFRFQTATKDEVEADLLHANSVEVFGETPLSGSHPLYAAGNVLVSLRHQDTVLVLDPEEQRLVWAWGQGEVSGQHDARLLDNGRFLVFDNGFAIGRSRVLELDPLTREVVWEYGSAEEEAFFSRGRGSSQRLPNGNTLICESNSGEAFEVTASGRVVWRFWNPEINAKGKRAAISRMVHYPAELVEPLLRR